MGLALIACRPHRDAHFSRGRPLEDLLERAIDRGVLLALALLHESRKAGPAGRGTYLWLESHRALRGRPLEDLLERAIDRGVLLAPGRAFGNAYAEWARLCYSAVPPDRLQLGLIRLRQAIESL